jgi:hypothetical protein
MKPTRTSLSFFQIGEDSYMMMLARRAVGKGKLSRAVRDYIRPGNRQGTNILNRRNVVPIHNGHSIGY